MKALLNDLFEKEMRNCLTAIENQAKTKVSLSDSIEAIKLVLRIKE